jgi:hypothetical protein
MPIWLTAILAICRIANVGRVDLYDFSGDEFGKWITAGTHVPLCQSFRGKMLAMVTHARDRNSPTRADQISLQRLSTSREHQPIRVEWPDGLGFR